MAHWRGHESGVSGLDFLTMESPKQMFFSCGKDTNVSLWTVSGQLVGSFGIDCWKLDDPCTWRDQEVPQDRPINDDMDDLFQEV